MRSNARPRVQRRIRAIVRRLAARFRPDQIILFGSHARGSATPDSDVDLLVVMPLEGGRREKEIEIAVAVGDIRMAKDIIVAAPEELERFRDVAGTVIRAALREGKVVYARTG